MNLENSLGAIFDMDGVLVDNNSWHIRAWIQFAGKYGRSITPEEVESHFGNTNRDYLSFLFQREISEEEEHRLAEEKEEIYRSLYAPHIQPVKGLLPFLEDLCNKNFKIALATGGPQSNVEFVFRHLGIKNFFDALVYDSMVKKGKPDPQIFLEAGRLLRVPHHRCVVFEDSVNGIQAAIHAGMIPVGIEPSGRPSKLSKAVRVVQDFTALTAQDIIDLLNTYQKSL